MCMEKIKEQKTRWHILNITHTLTYAHICRYLNMYTFNINISSDRFKQMSSHWATKNILVFFKLSPAFI